MGLFRRSLVRVLWLAACAGAETAPASGQRLPVFDARLVPQAAPTTTDPGIAFAASAIVPGAGQFLLKADRWVPFLALEVWGWVSYADRHNDANRLARQYRDLAWVAGRRNSIGERRDSTFEYYEAMSHFAASGLFDFDPRLSGVQPELDATTYNGEQWRLAKSIYFSGGVEYPVGSPQYTRALEYYQTRAIPASFAWAWGASNLELQTFRDLIRSSDESYRDATQILGVILVNHVVSAVDALVLARIQAARRSGLNLRVDSRMEPGWAGPRWSAELRLFW
jgi:hypothetical protein